MAQPGLLGMARMCSTVFHSYSKRCSDAIQGPMSPLICISRANSPAPNPVQCKDRATSPLGRSIAWLATRPTYMRRITCFSESMWLSVTPASY